MFRSSPKRSRLAVAVVTFAVCMLAACGSEQSSGGRCTVELAAATTDAQLERLVQALRASSDPCGLQAPGAMRADMLAQEMAARQMRASQAELVSIDRGESPTSCLKVTFAVASER